MELPPASSQSHGGGQVHALPQHQGGIVEPRCSEQGWKLPWQSWRLLPEVPDLLETQLRPCRGAGENGQVSLISRPNLPPGALPAWSHLLKAWAIATFDSLHSIWGKGARRVLYPTQAGTSSWETCCSLGYLTTNKGGTGKRHGNFFFISFSI